MRYKLIMFGIPLDGTNGLCPENVYCDNEVVYKNTRTVIPRLAFCKKHHSISYHRWGEAVTESIIRVTNQVMYHFTYQVMYHLTYQVMYHIKHQVMMYHLIYAAMYHPTHPEKMCNSKLFITFSKLNIPQLC